MHRAEIWCRRSVYEFSDSCLLDGSILAPELYRLHVLGPVQRHARPAVLLAKAVAHHGDRAHGQLVVGVLRLDGDNAPRSIWRAHANVCEA